MKEFEIFRTGKWTSSSGFSHDYSEDDLDKIVQNFNEDDPVPIVVGHPKTNAPAYGWIKNIKRVKDRLIAIPKQVDAAFKKLLEEGKFKKRSISLTPDLKLNHVGFLGAAAPAVEGLKDIKFSSDLKLNNFESDFLMPPMPSSVGNDSNSEPSVYKPSKSDENDDSSFQHNLDDLSTLVKDLKQNFSKLSEDEIKKIHNRIDQLRFSIQVNDFELMLNEKVAYGSVTPAMKNKILKIINFLQSNNFSSAAFSYDEFLSDVKNLFVEFVESIPKIIYYENYVSKPEHSSVVLDEEFSAYEVDKESSDLHKKALLYMKSHKDCDYLTAVINISEGNK